MDEVTKRSLAKKELYQAIVHYIERQQLVVQAMLDLNLDLEAIGKFGALAWGYDESSSETNLDQFEKLLQGELGEYQRALLNARKYAIEVKISRKGTWKDKLGQEWAYHLHGGGCLLLNNQTQEPLDWDCPNPKAFDVSFFSTHLDWRLTINQADPEIQFLRDALAEYNSVNDLVDGLLKELVEDNMVIGVYMPMGLVYTMHGDS